MLKSYDDFDPNTMAYFDVEGKLDRRLVFVRTLLRKAVLNGFFTTEDCAALGWSFAVFHTDGLMTPV